jgi:hypothetical protein
MSCKQSNKTTKFCKVCHDSGKTEKEYTSHFIRETPSPSAKITCPTLLSQECRYCFKSGHTVKYCTVLLEQKILPKQTKINTPHNNKQTKKQNIISKNNDNIFSVLDNELDDFVQINKKTKKVKKPLLFPLNSKENTNNINITNTNKNNIDEFPVLSLTKPCSTNIIGIGNYKSALEKPLEPIDSPVNIRVITLSKPAPWVKKDLVKIKSWSDYYSDDEENEEEKYVANDAW